MKYILSIIGNGGEFSLGQVTNTDEILFLESKIENSDLDLYNVDDVAGFNITMDFYDYNNILYNLGPDVSTLGFILTEIKEDDTQVVIVDTYTSNTEIENYHTISVINPYLDGINSTGFVFGGWTFAKGIVMEYSIETIKEFDFSNLYLCTMNLDETFQDTEILYKVLYLESDYEINEDAVIDNFDKLEDLVLVTEIADEGGIRSSGVVVYKEGELIYSN